MAAAGLRGETRLDAQGVPQHEGADPLQGLPQGTSSKGPGKLPQKSLMVQILCNI